MSSTFSVPTGQLVEKLVHTDPWLKTLEKRVHSDLCEYDGHGTTPPIQEMRAYAAAHPKYTRSCLFVKFEAGTCTVDLPVAQPNERGVKTIDSRAHTFVRMLQDLGAWCTKHGLVLPETDFAIYVSDTYAWEPDAAPFPWFVMAKPENRRGLLIPDDSFVTHGLAGPEPLESISPTVDMWAWDQCLESASQIKGKSSGTVQKFFFKGANTGAEKWNVRDLMRTATASNRKFLIDLEPGKESWYKWARYGALLDLPGQQPWSYRRKYLHLLGRPVVQVDVERFIPQEDGTLGEPTKRWIQFFDGLFTASKNYVPVSVTYTDGHRPLLPDIRMIQATSLQSREAKKISRKFNGRLKLRKMTSSHVIQHLYMQLWHYKMYFA